MTPRLCALVVCAVIGAASIAGCGSSSSKSSSAAPASSTSATKTPAASGSGSPVGSDLASAVAACKAGASQSTLPASLKTKILAICNQVANGNEAGAKKAGVQVCQEIVKATVPAADQTKALASCPKS